MKNRFGSKEEAKNYLTFRRGFKIYGMLIKVPKDVVIGIKTWGVLDYLGFGITRAE